MPPGMWELLIIGVILLVTLVVPAAVIGVAVYLAIAAAITLVAVVSMRETKGSSLHDLDRIDEARLTADRAAV